MGKDAGQQSKQAKKDAVYTEMRTNNKAQDTIQKTFEAIQFAMTSLPMIVLMMLFFLQIFSLTVGKMLRSQQSQNISHAKIAFKFAVYLVLMVFWRPMTMWIIDAFNGMSIALASIEDQKEICSALNTIFFSTAQPSISAIISGLIITVCGFVVRICLHIMVITRDVIMALTVMMGPICLAFGYYQNMTSGMNVLGQYFAGWCGNFIKINLWGIVIAMLYLSLGLYAVIMPAMSNSLLGSIILACTFVAAAGNVPSFSEKMSGLAMTSLIMAVPGTTGGRIKQWAKLGTTYIGATARDAVINSSVSVFTHVGRWVSRRRGD